MRSYCALYIDAGYLLAGAATRLTGTSLRGGVTVDHAMLVDRLVTQVREISGLELLRVHWYDSGARPGGVPDEEQDAIGMLPRVKIRLGRRSYSGEQKGVDLRIGLDLVNHARNRAVDVAYLVSGDDDLTEAVEEAQGLGVQVIVLAVPNAMGRPHGVARHLQREADGLELVSADTIDEVCTARTRVDTVRPAESPGASQFGEHVPTPAELAARRMAPTPPVPGKSWSTGAPAVVPRPPVLLELPSSVAPVEHPVYSSRTGQSSYLAPAFDDDHVDDVIEEVCHGVVRTWDRNASTADRAGLWDGRPSIPADLDRALLMDLSDRLKIYDIEEGMRFRLRSHFWNAVEASQP